MSTKDIPGKLLSDLTIADLGVGLSAAIVATYFADNGARVLRIEPPEGDPWYDQIPAYRVWRRKAEHASQPVDQVFSQADLILLGGEPHPDLHQHHDPDAIAAAYPRAVVVVIGSGAHGTDYDDRPLTEILAQARSGLTLEHYSSRPIYMAFEPANYGAAFQALIGGLGALIERERSQLGQVVRTSLFEGALTWAAQFWQTYEKPTPMATFSQPKDPWPLIFKAKDGVYIHLVLGAFNSKYAAYQALEIDDPSVKPGDNGMPDIHGSAKNFYGDWDLLAERVSRFESAALLQRLWDLGVDAEPCHPPAYCRETEQAEFNELLVVEPDGIKRLGSPVSLRASASERKLVRRPAANRPLEGRRVLDFGSFVAGPLATVAISDLGADVIKIEAPSGDPTRGMTRAFTFANRGKRDVVLDLKTPKDLALAKQIIGTADAVTNNFRPGVSTKLGIDPAALLSMRSDLVVMEAPGYGAEGPLSGRGAFDPLMQAFCGHEIRAAGEGNAPFWNRCYPADVSGGLIGSIGLLTAMLHHDRTGHGVCVRSSLLNASAFLLSEMIQLPNGDYVGLRDLDAGRTGYHPAEAFYQCSDGWIALVARNSAQAAALAAVLGLGPELAGPLEKWADREREAIAAALRPANATEVVRRLRLEGVWVEEVNSGMEETILSDDRLTETGLVRVSQHAQLGEMRELGVLFSLSRSALGSSRPFPAPGEHTAEVIEALLGAPLDA